MNSLGYAELHTRSNFTFLHGASHPEELVRRAHDLGYAALALTDLCSLAGVVRAHQEARACGLHLIVGSEIRLRDGPRLVLLAQDRAGYGRLSTLISRGRRRAEKGACQLARADLEAGLAGCVAIWLPSPDGEAAEAEGRWLKARFADRLWIGVAQLRRGEDARLLAQAERLGRRFGIPLVAAGGVWMHAPERQPLQDTLTAIRLRRPLAEAGFALEPNAERHLRPWAALARLYPPALLAETLHIAERCTFSLDELRYEYPDELVPAGVTPAAHLRALVEEGARRRWPEGMPAKVRKLIEHELALIAGLRYEPYFLTVHDIVRFARSRGILCQGRGSAANSAVCYALGITEVDPARMEMLFERFLSKERDEPPDIDVDFEHHRREEVIQYIYGKYGRDRAALAATVISYRPRSALRDVGRALGLTPDQVDRLAKSISWWDGRQVLPERLVEAGFDPANPVIQRLMARVAEIMGFPRHLSQHVGGFVISRGPLTELVPVENAAMAGRTLIQWDKDDLEALGLLKVDCLALGMLSAIHRAFDLINGFHGTRLGMQEVPAEDPAVYRMIQHADTVGVFQIESRAQMSMLPRLRPACFYDLVIEVAIVRPGPIQGDMVHPYLRRRQGLEPVEYPSPEVEAVLGRTLGVPIFQEQVIKVAQVAAGFGAGEADQLRRSIAAWRRRGTLEQFEQRLIDGMVARGYEAAFARRIYRQILGFGEYGFPESHAASFALLVYVSAWLKCHHPAAFFAALLDSQPMGFYAPAQLVQAARRAGVDVRPVDVRHSGWDSRLEPAEACRSKEACGRGAARRDGDCNGPDRGRALPLPQGGEGEGVRGRGAASRDGVCNGLDRGRALPLPQEAVGEEEGCGRGAVRRDGDCNGPDRGRALPLPQEAVGGEEGCGKGAVSRDKADGSRPALRLGLRQVKGLSLAGAERLVAARAERPFDSVEDLARRAGLNKKDLEALAAADALQGLAGNRHQAAWAVAGVQAPLPLFPEPEAEPAAPLLRPPTEGEGIVADYASIGLTLGRHPLALLRGRLARKGMITAAEVARWPHGVRVCTGGLVINRQRPGSAHNVTFMTLEDETGQINLVVWQRVAERQRAVMLRARLLGVVGEVQREGEVVHVVVRRLYDHSPLLGGLMTRSRDFR